MTAPGHHQHQREALTIVMAATAGEASDAQLARLSQLIVEDRELALFVVQLLSQEAWLTWHASQARGDQVGDQSAHQFDEMLERALAPSRGLSAYVSSSAPVGSERGVTGNEEGRVGVGTSGSSRPMRAQSLTYRLLSTQALSASLLIGMGMLIGAWAMHWAADVRRAAPVTLHEPGNTKGLQVAPSPYVARLVHGTACVWDPEMTSQLSSNGVLRSGESLNLIEGLAEVESDWPAKGHAKLQLEGPAGLVLTAAGAASLSYGKFTVDVQLGLGAYTLETPFGRVVVMEDAELGIAVFGNELEIHVFRGQAVFSSPWMSESEVSGRMPVATGGSIRLIASDRGPMTVVRGQAEPGYFASRTSMFSDRLLIPREYVRAVTAAKPVTYWRFEEPDSGLVRNEVGDKFSGQVVGTPVWVNQGHNRAIEFGSGLTLDELRTYVVATDSFDDDLSNDYTIEFWIKPSHYHLGAVVSLVGEPLVQGGQQVHGMLLELGGPHSTLTNIEHPGRLRFLHRDPPSDDLAQGTSCFSEQPYGLRRWQHVVALKRGARMELFVNGALAATGKDDSRLSQELTLLVGQLDTHRDTRHFVGQLDELAVYARALSEMEIRQHYELVRLQHISKQSI